MSVVGGNVSVIGAGVIGLTTAVLLQQNGWNVTVIARDLPGTFATTYTSPWAGAHWRSRARHDDQRLKEYERVTFLTFLSLVRERDAGVQMMPFFEYWDEGATQVEFSERPWFADLVSEFRVLPAGELPPGATRGIAYTSVVIDPKKYLKFLLALFRHAGGIVRQQHLEDVGEAIDDNVDVVVNCTGNGARTLKGVEDIACYPTRGQTVLVRAPKVAVNVMRYGPHGLSYIIPRGDGTVILGGTFEARSTKIEPDASTAAAIIRRNLAHCPQLKGSETKGRAPEKADRVDVIQHCVGLRPTRTGGIRVEIEQRNSPGGKRVMLCHHYGHGGYGYQSSWGSANELITQLNTARTRAKL